MITKKQKYDALIAYKLIYPKVGIVELKAFIRGFQVCEKIYKQLLKKSLN